MTADYDVIVVGAGVMGLSCAYELAKRGRKVCVLEQAMGAVNLNGASHGESRIIRLTHSDETYLPLAIESYRSWRLLEHETGSKLYENHGLLWLGDEKGTRERAQILERYKAPHEILNNKQIKQRYKHLDYDSKWWAVLDHTAGTIYSRKCMEALKTASENRGVQFNYGVKVTGWKASDNHVVVKTENRDFNSRSVVFAVGGWLDKLHRGRLPIRVHPVAVPVFFWNIQPTAVGLFDVERKSPNLIISDVWRDEELFLIPNADYEGKVKFAVHLGEDFDTDGPRPTKLVEINRNISRRHIQEHIRGIDSRMPGIETGCLYANTVDRSFIVDGHPDHPNVVVASGFSGTGFKFAPVIGDIVADLLDGRKPRYDIRNFSVDRQIDLSRSKL
ncbi:Peroxisomal sarcosine oxidase [Aphelenchoides besseyi]|nr:Peroxisomal sarcosine oxidase [Aphelenchoides besseyi]KAI6193427.1 Peroxisomal sarcosine oxidase [Aphelenchoides besseyi]